MAVPLNALTCTYVMDPSDLVDFIYDARPEMASDDTGPTEFVANGWLLEMSPEGAAVGLVIRNDGPRQPSVELLSGGIRFWLAVSSDQSAAAFAGAGLDIGIDILVPTTNVPSRRIDRTVVVTVRQR